MHFIPCEVVFVRFTSSPPLPTGKSSVLCSTRNYASSWKDLERTSTFGAELNLCLIADFLKWPVWLFSPSSHSPLLARFLERSRNSQNRCLPNRPGFFSQS